MTEKIGFIGTGNMGTALLTGARNAYEAERFVFYDMNPDKRDQITDKLGIGAAEDTADVAGQAKYLFLMVKPQSYEEVLTQIRDQLREDHILVSVAPGVTAKWIYRITGWDEKDASERFRVVRVMPNTPALLGAGMTGYAYGEGELTDEENEVIRRIFASCGKACRVDESLMDAVICASGSSPAFYYLVIDAIAKRCEALGMTREDAVLFSAQAAYGSAQMVLEAGEDPAVLAERVCSKGGTTIEGVRSLQKDDLDGVMARAVDATYARAVEMRKE